MCFLPFILFGCSISYLHCFIVIVTDSPLQEFLLTEFMFPKRQTNAKLDEFWKYIYKQYQHSLGVFFFSFENKKTENFWQNFYVMWIQQTLEKQIYLVLILREEVVQFFHYHMQTNQDNLILTPYFSAMLQSKFHENQTLNLPILEFEFSHDYTSMYRRENKCLKL